ncbi:MAG: alpha/beta hydrolase [Chitinophagaceae bacterium]|nr:alpha/beta hydrolase [Chitinophagaceae bacterium]
MKTFILVIGLFLTFSLSAQEVVQLYNSRPSGSENWDWSEKTVNDPGVGAVVSQVTDPSLTIYRPSKPNGTAIIIAPGGAFRFLSFDLEGTTVAKRLNAEGITAFVLKYRLIKTDPTPVGKELDSMTAAVIPLAVEDGVNAMKYVRSHSKDFAIDPNRIGFMGFSAGGTVTMSVVYTTNPESHPNFVMPIYGYSKAVIGNKVPEAKTPIFIVVASDDPYKFAPHSLEIYSKWLEAGQPAEFHAYERGGHGFGTRPQNLPVDNWMSLLVDWLNMHHFVEQVSK